MPVRIVIIGGGASGLAAAITAARQDADVTILEHKDRVGKKILMTGNGKCNLTNLSDYHGKYYGENIKSIYGVLSRFTPMDTIEFFKEIGLYTKQKKDGGIYPVSEQASAVLDVLRTTCDHLGVKTLTECEPSKIITGKNGGTVQYIYQKKEKRQIPYDKLILATGGQAAPVSGSDGTGYQLARSLGHHLITPLPALVQLRCEGNYFKSISGVRAQAELNLYINKQQAAREEGELQLTDYGISGIPVFQFSRIAARAIKEKKQCEVHINFLPYLTRDELQNLEKEQYKFAYKTVEEFLSGIVNKKIASLMCRRYQIKQDTLLGKVQEKTFRECLRELTDFTVSVKEANPFENAQVCCGGIPLSEVTDNLESKYNTGVYITGELLDCDGICGGYNLQWAWATGILAVRDCVAVKKQ